jgi:hypothetical protein
MDDERKCPFFEEVAEDEPVEAVPVSVEEVLGKDEEPWEKVRRRKAVAKCTITAGLVVRGAMRRLLASQRHLQNGRLDIRWSETGGWLESLFCVEAEGAYEDAYEWITKLKRLVDEYG